MEFYEGMTFEEFAQQNNGRPVFNPEMREQVKNMSWDEFVGRREDTKQKLESILASMDRV
jgi:hypothetical protein